MTRTRLLLAVLLCVAGSARADGARSLAGRYTSAGDGPEVTLELRANGTCRVAGEAGRWSVHGDQLVLRDQTYAFRRESGRLVLIDGRGHEVVWLRKLATARPRVNRARPLVVRDAALRDLLVSTPWCAEAYSRATGETRETRAVFHADGTLAFETVDEGLVARYAATGAGRRGSPLRWAVDGERLLIDPGDGPQDVGLQVAMSDEEQPVLRADGRDYLKCASADANRGAGATGPASAAR